MKTYTLNSTLYMLILTTFLMMPVVSVCAYDGAGNSDRLSSVSSSVFSPGYINAAKHQTEAILGQIDPRKSFMERLVENVKKGLSNNVNEAADTKVTAEVKKKTSAKSTTAQSGEAPVIVPVNLNPDDIPAYIRDEIQKYVEAHNNGYSSAYTLKQSNGTYYAFWQDSTSSIKAQTFDSSGIAISKSPSTLTGDRVLNNASISNVTVLPNSSVVAFWGESDSNNKYSIKTQRFDSSGIAIPESLSTLTGDRVLNNAYISNITVLPNSSAVAFWYEIDSNNKYSIKTQTFDLSGIAIPGSLSTLTGDRVLNYTSISNVTILPSGSVAAFWYESDSNNKYSLKTQRFDSSGIAIPGSLSALTGDRVLNNAGVSNVTILPNGSVAAFWYEIDLNNKNSIKTQRFDLNGIAITGSLSALTGDRVLNYASISNIYVLPDGSVAAFWYELDLNYKYFLKTQRFDSSGIAIPGSLSTLTGNRVLNNASISNVTVLPDGSVVAFWYELGLNNKYSLKTQRFDSSGIAIDGSLISLTADRLLNYASISNVTILPNGSVAAFWYELGLNNKYSLKTQRFDSSGIAIIGSLSTLTGDRVLNYASISNISILPNGRVAAFWYEIDSNNKYSIKAQTFDLSGIAIPGSLSTLTGDRVLNNANIRNVTVLPNGSVAAFWWERDLNNIYSLKTQRFDSSGIAIPGSLYILTGDRVLDNANISNVTILPNSSVVAFWYELDLNYKNSLKTQRFDSSGIAIPGSLSTLTGDRVLDNASISNISVLPNGSVAAFWYELDLNNKYSLKTQALNANGSVVSNDTLKPTPTLASTSNLKQNLLPDAFLNSLKSNILNNSSYGFELRSVMNNSGNNAVPEIFKSLLSSKGVLATNMGRPTNEAELGRLITQALNSQIGVPVLTATEANMPETQIALALANILKNPTEDQKLIIDAIMNLLADMPKIEKETGRSEDLTKAENELLQMAVAVLLTQGIPDLLKEGDVENIKGMFKDLGASKDKVLLDFNNSIKPYYNNIAKEIAANIAVLELKGIVNKKLTEEELRKMEPREIDRILDNIRKNNDNSFELGYILQQDSKYRKEYLNPSKKLMEDSMKNILGTFAKRISEALEEEK